MDQGLQPIKIKNCQGLRDHLWHIVGNGPVTQPYRNKISRPKGSSIEYNCRVTEFIRCFTLQINI